jgi:hypothetical protein
LPALLALGCAATASLHAKPEIVCAGRAVRLTWDGSGSGELSAEPADPTLGDVAQSGSKTVRPKATTTYRFHVGSLISSATSGTTVKVVAVPELPAPVRGSATDEGGGCAPSRMWVTARAPADAWDSRLRVNLVASADGRAYRVEHAARSTELGVDTPSDELRDLPIAGAWRLETALRPGEVCGESSAPASLAVNVTLVCAD